MNRSKVEEQKGKYIAFKGKFGPKNRGRLNWSWERFAEVVRAIPSGVDRGFNSATIQPRFGGELTSILFSKEPRSRHDRVTIAPRSGHDRASIVVLMLQRPPSNDRGGDSTTKDARSRHDCGSIGPRSLSSSANHPGRPMELQVSGRSRSPDPVCPIVRRVHRLMAIHRPMKIVRLLTPTRLMRIGRPICVHVSACGSSWMMLNLDR